MALKGTLSTAYKGWTYKIEWSATQSVANNTSTVTCKHLLVCASSYGLYIGTRDNSCTVGGVKASFTSPKISTGGGSTITLGTTTHLLKHADNGTLTKVAVSGTFNIKATLSGTYKDSIAVSGTIDLDTIPRKSTLTASNGTLATAQTLTINRAATSFTHTITYKCGTATGTIATKTTGTSVSWTPPLSLAAQNTTGTSVSVTFTITTYSGDTSVGSNTKTISCSIPASIKPTCSIQVLDATSYKDTYGNLIKGLSKLQVKTTGTPAQGSPIASYNVTANGTKYTKADITTGVLTSADTTTVTATVTDKRGRTSAAASASFPVIDYVRPTVTELSVHRCDEDGTENEEGAFVQVTFSAKVTPLNNKNSATYTLRYGKDTASLTSVPLSALSGQYTVTDYTYRFAADSEFSYTIEVEAKDDIDKTTRFTTVSTAFALMDWHESGTGLRFGGVAEDPYTLQNDLRLKQVDNSYCFGTQAGNTMGYVAMAQIEIISVYANAPIKFEFSHRSSASDMTVHVRFYNENNLDPSLNSIVYEGDNLGAFLVNSAPSVWVLYVGKRYANDGITLQRWTAPVFMNDRVRITFPGDAVTEVPQGLRGFYRATPAKLQSILDYIYPVGSIYLSYSHVSPASLFGGTWERIKNAFLWAVDESGTIGQTGGEKTHKLTTAELPAHQHNSNRGAMFWNSAHGNVGHATGTTLASAGVLIDANVATATAATGGGAAHNNMPPYIQVSAWRRTA